MSPMKNTSLLASWRTLSLAVAGLASLVPVSQAAPHRSEAPRFEFKVRQEARREDFFIRLIFNFWLMV